jgi:hypothetical protein
MGMRRTLGTTRGPGLVGKARLAACSRIPDVLKDARWE